MNINKIRHIKESNLILEKRLLESSSVEYSSELSTLNNILSKANLPQINTDELDELIPDCPVEIPDNKYKNLVLDLQKRINSVTDIATLEKELIKIQNHKQSVQEQLGAMGTTVMVLGLAVPGPAFVIVAGTLTLLIVLQLGKLIFSRKVIKHKSSGYSTCKRRSKLRKKFGLDAYFM